MGRTACRRHDRERGGDVDFWGRFEQVLGHEPGEVLVGHGRALPWLDLYPVTEDKDVACQI